MISLYKSVLKNQILTRCIGPAFIEKIHDAHIKEKTNPNEITIGDEYAPYYYVNEYISQFVVLVNSGWATEFSKHYLTPVGNGTAVITAHALDGSGVVAKCVVTVNMK